MRTIICVVTFVILLLIGFLGTPGLFKIVNPEYLLALREYSPSIAKLTQDASDIEPQIANLRSKISIIAKGLRDLGDTWVAKQAAMKIANATPSEIAEVGIDFGKQSNALGSAGRRTEDTRGKKGQYRGKPS